MDNKVEDTGKMGVRSNEKKIFFSQNVTSFKQNDRWSSFKSNVLQMHHTTVILKKSKFLKG